MLNICDLSNALRTFSILCWKQLNSNYINKSITFPKKGQKKKTWKNAQQIFPRAIYRSHVLFFKQDKVSYGLDAYTTQGMKKNPGYKRTD